MPGVTAHAGRGCGCGATAPPSSPGVLILRTRRDRARLAGLIPAYAGLRLDVPGLPPDRRAWLERALERDYLECGCRAGARTMAAGAAATLAVVIYWRLTSDHVAPRQLLGAAALVLAATLAVKFAVVVRARVRLYRTLGATLPSG